MMGTGEPGAVLSLLTGVVFVIGWLGAVVFLRQKKAKSLVFLFFFTVFFVYLFFVLSYTLFEFQSLIVLKWFVPGLMLRGQAEGQSLNLVPLVGLTAAEGKTSLLNVILLMPFGFGLPFLLRLGLARVTSLAALFSLSIEALQWGSGVLANLTFRVADVNDLIFNTLGAALGYALFLGFLRLVRLVFPNGEKVKHPVLRYVRGLAPPFNPD